MLRSYYDSRLRLSDARPPIVRIKDAKINFESFSELEDDLPVDPMRVSWQDLDGQPTHGGANSQGSSVSSSSPTVPGNVQVPNRAKMHTSEEELHHVPRRSPRFMFARVLDYGDMHHYQRLKLLLVMH